MDRPTKEIKLENSGYLAKIVTFFTRGEATEINSSRFKGGNIKYVNDEVVIENVPLDFKKRQEDALLVAGVKFLLDKDNKEIAVTQEVLDNLPDKDTKILLLELYKIYLEDEEGKKKA